MLSKIGGRKFLVNLLVLAIGIAVDLFTERGLSENLMYLLFGATTGYGVVNVGKYMVNLKQQKQELELSAPDLTPVLTGIESIADYVVRQNKPKRGKGSTVKVDTSAFEGILREILEKIEASTKQSSDPEVLNYLKAVQNQGVVIADTLKQSTQLQVQTHQTIMGLITQAQQR